MSDGCPFHHWIEYCPLYHAAHAGLLDIEAGFGCIYDLAEPCIIARTPRGRRQARYERMAARCPAELIERLACAERDREAREQRRRNLAALGMR